MNTLARTGWIERQDVVADDRLVELGRLLDVRRVQVQPDPLVDVARVVGRIAVPGMDDAKQRALRIRENGGRPRSPSMTGA